MASQTPERTPCWHCRHMVSVDARSGVVGCGRDRQRGPSTMTSGSRGCSDWEREPGIDDDDWNPPGSPVIAPYKPDPPPAPRNSGRDGWWTEPPRPRRIPAPLPLALPRPSVNHFWMFEVNDD